MAKQYKTIADIYSLVEPQKPLESEYRPGDIVTIRTKSDRLESHGWIKNTNDRKATLTGYGAAILNFYKEREAEETLDKVLNHGGGYFVQRAIESHGRTDEWEVLIVDDEELIVEDEEGRARRYQPA